MKTRVITAVLFVTVLCAAPALAQLRAGTWELNGFAGYLFGGSLGHSQGFELPSYDVDVNGNANYGGRLGYNFTSVLELEFEYSQTNTAFGIASGDPNNPQNNQANGNLKIQYFMGYVTFNFGHGRLVPFFTIGGGVADLGAHRSGPYQDRSDTRFTGGIGGGIKYFLSPHFALRADGRLLSTDLGSATGLCGYYYTCTQNTWLNNGTATGGFVFAF